MIPFLRWTAAAVLACALCNCAPVRGADPLGSAQVSASGLRPPTTDPARQQDDTFYASNRERAAESENGVSFHGSAGLSAGAEW